MAFTAAAAIAGVLFGSEVIERFDQATTRLGIVEDQLADTRRELEHQRQASELLTSPDSVSVRLAGTEAAPAARARVTYDARSGEALLVATNLPTPAADKAYQFWFITQEKTQVPGKRFRPDPSGRGVLRDTIPAQARESAVFAVTLEPTAGAPAPTGPTVLLGARS